jgi:tetratricopeptide (TPR) repeat protein
VPWVIYHAKQYDEAEKQYLELLKKFDSDYRTSGVRETMREARFVLSNICVHQERTAEAEEWLEQVLDEFPENIGAMNDLGYLWADGGKNLQRALGMIQKAVEAEPENIAYLDSLGWILYRVGRYDDAVRELEKAAAGDEPDAVILDHLADAYLKAGNKAKALETWRRAIKRLDDGDAKKRTEIEQKLKKHTAE